MTTTMSDASNIPVFVLCGGLGTRLAEETVRQPKPMVPIGRFPILWHIMEYYGHYGFRKFVLCTGSKSEIIKSYFLSHVSLNSDFTVNLESNEIKTVSGFNRKDWDVTVLDTGELTMTGGRVARACETYLNAIGSFGHFAVTYGDGLTDADLTKELDHHLSRNQLGTVLGVAPPSRFGEFKLDGNEVLEFVERPEFEDKWINGGYFFFDRGFLEYLSKDEACVLERKPLAELARNRQLNVYRHDGFWACMDTQRDRSYLEGLWASGKAPWAKWARD